MVSNNFRLVSSIMLTSSAALGLLFAIPLWMGRIGPNRWTGFRNAKTLADPALWFAVNSIMGMEMFFLNLAILALTMIFYFSNLVKSQITPPMLLAIALVLGDALISLHCSNITA